MPKSVLASCNTKKHKYVFKSQNRQILKENSRLNAQVSSNSFLLVDFTKPVGQTQSWLNNADSTSSQEEIIEKNQMINEMNGTPSKQMVINRNTLVLPALTLMWTGQ